MCLCSLSYPSRKEHAPYYNIGDLPGSTIYFTLSHKRHDIQESVIEYKMRVLIFNKTYIWNISNSKKSTALYDHQCT